MPDVPETDTTDDPRRERVLDAALKLVVAHGYHRTTMDDVARAVQISRPALYLLFRNKADIYRGVSARMFDQTVYRMEAILAGSGTLAHRLLTGIEEAMIDVMCVITQSPHGAEILDLKNDLAGDLVENWHRSISKLFREAIEREMLETGTDLRQRGLDAGSLAQMLVDGLHGMKTRTHDRQEQRDAACQLVRVIELAIAK